VTRFFRPVRLLRSADAVWLLDESWPVAVQLVGGEPLPPVVWSWPEVPSDDDACRVVIADGVGLVVAEGGQVIWVRHDGHTSAPVDADLVLAAADPDTAWFCDQTQINPGEPPSFAAQLPPGRIVMMRRDGSSQQVITPAPVNAVGVRSADVWVTLADPPVAHPGPRKSWHFEYPSSVVRVARDRLLNDGLASAVPAVGGFPGVATTLRDSRWTWLAEEPQWILQHGVPVGGLVWAAGAPIGVDKINRRAVVVGHDPTGSQPPVRVDLGPGLVHDVQAIGDELWVVVARRRYLAVPLDRGVDVLAVTASGAVRTVLGADSIDVSASAPPLRRPSDEQIRAQVDEVREMFDDLENFWHSPDGTTAPLSRGLTDGAVSVEGEWPDTTVVVTLRHPRRPGLVLRRTLSLFDEEGCPIDRSYADVHLIEDLDTSYIAPAEEAVDGVLDT
jgi:hypothetical protein